MLKFNKIGSVSQAQIQILVPQMWNASVLKASISVCMPSSLAQTDSELLFPNLEGGSGGQ